MIFLLSCRGAVRPDNFSRGAWGTALLAATVLFLAALVATGHSFLPSIARSAGPLPAPLIELTGAAACNPEIPRTYLVAQHSAVEGADENRVSDAFSYTRCRWS